LGACSVNGWEPDWERLLCSLCDSSLTPAPTVTFACTVLEAANILEACAPQLAADLAAGRCFSWLPSGASGSADGMASDADISSTSREGSLAAGHGASSGGRLLIVPPADVAAAVEAQLAPNAEAAEELLQVGAAGRVGGGQ